MTFNPAAFDQVAEGHFRGLPGSDARDLMIWRDGVDSGRLFLFAILHRGRRVGSMIWTVETEADGARALVVQAMFSEPVRGVDMFAQVNARMGEFARLMGLHCLRFWTVREGLRRKAQRAGYVARYVMERAV